MKFFAFAISVFLGLTVSSPAAPDQKIFFNVRDFGAVGDGKTLDGKSINQAIQTAAKTGGGTIFIPAGTYLCGSIHLADNINLFLDAGAVILGAPQNLGAYDAAEAFVGQAYQDAGHTYFHNSLIWGENLTNISITGPGMINGGGLERDSKIAPPATANKAIALKLCRQVRLRDVTIYHGGWFAILATGCENMTVDNVTMDTDRDGIDIDCCRNVTVSNCRINSPLDDGLCLKSSFALGRNVITENVTIANCEVSGFQEGTLLDGTMKPMKNGTGRIKFGTEANGGFRNIAVANCTFRGCRGLALEEVDGGILENISINNITMMDVAGYPIYIATGNRNRGPNVTAPSRIRNVLISNVIATGVDSASGIQITGLPEQPIENIRLQNIRLIFNGGGTRAQAEKMPDELGKNYPEPRGVMPAYALFARHVRNLELADISVSFEKNDARPAIECTDADGLEIDSFKARLAQGVAAAKFDSIKNAVIRNSPVLDGVSTN